MISQKQIFVINNLVWVWFPLKANFYLHHFEKSYDLQKFKADISCVFQLPDVKPVTFQEFSQTVRYFVPYHDTVQENVTMNQKDIYYCMPYYGPTLLSLCQGTFLSQYKDWIPKLVHYLWNVFVEQGWEHSDVAARNICVDKDQQFHLIDLEDMVYRSANEPFDFEYMFCMLQQDIVNHFHCPEAWDLFVKEWDKLIRPS